MGEQKNVDVGLTAKEVPASIAELQDYLDAVTGLAL